MQRLPVEREASARQAAKDLPAGLYRGTSFLGRERDVSALRAFLVRPGRRLVTLVGPPGVGKTSLARMVAATLTDDFADGVAFVDLSPVRDHTLVARTIGRALGLPETGSRSSADALAGFLRDAETLLVLDNLEQVIECGAALAALLGRCPGLRLLATSREPLHVDVEQQYAVRPLPVPSLKKPLAAADLERIPATALFLDRARLVEPGFPLTEAAARAVAEICVRLDGLPLAIEMAAAQVKFLAPEAMARELARSPRTLVSSARNLPERHRTLHSCIAWSYDLLTPAQQAVFKAVAAFRGGFSPEAAEAVAGEPLAQAVPDAVVALVDKSLLEVAPQPDGTPRLTPLESVREFALELLEASGEAEDVRRRHARYYLGLAQRLDRLIRGPEQDVRANQLEAEQDNFRAAMTWAIATGQTDLAADLGWALHWFWYFYGHNREGREWLARVLTSDPPSSPPARARALAAAGVLAWSISEYRESDRWLSEAVPLLREAEDAAGLAAALHYFGHVLDLVRGERREALGAFEESIATFRQIGDAWGAAFSTNCSGLALAGLGEFERAVARMDEAHLGYQGVGDRRLLAWGRADLGSVLASKGDAARAARLLRSSVSMLRTSGASVRLAWALAELGDIALREGDRAGALAFYKEVLILTRELGMRPAVTLGGIGIIAWSMGDARTAARMLGAADAVARAIETRGGSVALSAGAPLKHKELLEETAAQVRRSLGDAAFEAAWTEGASAGLDEIVEEALAIEDEPPAPVERAAHDHADAGPLSRREREVATLIAQGLSNREIARALLIGHRTVATHVQSILNKLGVDRRSQIAAWAAARGLHIPAS